MFMPMDQARVVKDEQRDPRSSCEVMGDPHRACEEQEYVHGGVWRERMVLPSQGKVGLKEKGRPRSETQVCT